MLLTVSAPSALAVSVADAKEHLRIEGDLEDALVMRLIKAATKTLEAQTGLRAVPVSLQFRQTGWQAGIDLPAAPVREVAAVSYLDIDNVEQVLPASVWYWRRTVAGAVVSYETGASLPSVSPRAESVRVDFGGGYDDPSAPTGDAVTAPDERIAQAVLLLVGHWYENRETVNVGNIVNELPLGFQRLAEQLRVRW